MPRTLKRRSDAISNDDSRNPSESPQPQRPRRRMSEALSESAEVSEQSGNEDPTQSRTQTTADTLIKNLVRLALSCEYSRTPLRRNDISLKILKDSTSSRSFKTIFEGAQRQLQDVFGMQLVELPSREKTTLKDRRAQATQTKSTSAANSSKSWVLISILPDAYKRNLVIMQPAQAGEEDADASYTGIYTFIVSLIYLNNGSLAENKLGRYLKRVNAETMTPNGSLDKLLQRMRKEGYIEQRKEVLQGEELVEWVVGPRGKIEIGAKGAAGLVRSVYGHGSVKLPNGVQKEEEDELNAKIKSSLGISVEAKANTNGEEDGEEEPQVNGDAHASEPANVPARRSARRRNDENENEEEEEEDDPRSGRTRRSTRRGRQDEDEDEEAEEVNVRQPGRRSNGRQTRSMIEDEAEAEDDEEEELEEDVEDDE